MRKCMILTGLLFTGSNLYTMEPASKITSPQDFALHSQNGALYTPKTPGLPKKSNPRSKEINLPRNKNSYLTEDAIPSQRQFIFDDENPAQQSLYQAHNDFQKTKHSLAFLSYALQATQGYLLYKNHDTPYAMLGLSAANLGVEALNVILSKKRQKIFSSWTQMVTTLQSKVRETASYYGIRKNNLPTEVKKLFSVIPSSSDQLSLSQVATMFSSVLTCAFDGLKATDQIHWLGESETVIRDIAILMVILSKSWEVYNEKSLTQKGRSQNNFKQLIQSSEAWMQDPLTPPLPDTQKAVISQHTAQEENEEYQQQSPENNINYEEIIETGKKVMNFIGLNAVPESRDPILNASQAPSYPLTPNTKTFRDKFTNTLTLFQNIVGKVNASLCKTRHRGEKISHSFQNKALHPAFDLETLARASTDPNTPRKITFLQDTKIPSTQGKKEPIFSFAPTSLEKAPKPTALNTQMVQPNIALSPNDNPKDQSHITAYHPTGMNQSVSQIPVEENMPTGNFDQKQPKTSPMHPNIPNLKLNVSETLQRQPSLDMNIPTALSYDYGTGFTHSNVITTPNKTGNPAQNTQQKSLESSDIPQKKTDMYPQSFQTTSRKPSIFQQEKIQSLKDTTQEDPYKHKDIHRIQHNAQLYHESADQAKLAEIYSKGTHEEYNMKDIQNGITYDQEHVHKYFTQNYQEKLARENNYSNIYFHSKHNKEPLSIPGKYTENK